jgi:hypothetical protein
LQLEIEKANSITEEKPKQMENLYRRKIAPNMMYKVENGTLYWKWGESYRWRSSVYKVSEIPHLIKIGLLVPA